MSNLANHTEVSNQNNNERGKHDASGTDTDTTPARDPEAVAYWRAACAAMPPMTAEEIATVAVVLRRINARRTGTHPHSGA